MRGKVTHNVAVAKLSKLKKQSLQIFIVVDFPEFILEDVKFALGD